MKKILISLFVLTVSFTVSAQNDFSRQLWRNFHLGWDVYKTNDYRWRNTFVGTAYTQSFEALPKAYWYVGGRINWNKYTLYPDGRYPIGGNNAVLKTSSLSLPTQLGYQLFNEKGFGMNVFTGPTFEFLFTSKLDGYQYNKVNYFQSGWTVGSSLRFLHIFGARVYYSYYPTSLLTDFAMPRQSFSFSLGF